MQRSNWNWLSKRNTPHYELQTVVDMLGYAENIGIQILDSEALQSLAVEDLLSDEVKDRIAPDQYLDALNDFCLNITSPKESESYLQRVFVSKPTTHEWVTKHERKVWLTQPSNPLPLYSLFRMNLEWRWFMLAWFRCNCSGLIRCANEEIADYPAFNCAPWEFRIRWIDLAGDNKKRYLWVFGPIYKPIPDDFQSTNHPHATSIIDNFYKFYQRTCHKSRSGLSDHKLMLRLLMSRLPLPSIEIDQRISNVCEIFLAMTQCLSHSDEYSYRRSELLAITRTLVGINRIANQSNEFEFQRKAGTEDKISFYFCLKDSTWSKQAKNNINAFVEVNGRFRNETFNFDSITWPIYEDLLSRNYNTQYLCGTKGAPVSSTQLDNINRDLARWHDRITVRRRFSQSFSSEILYNWLQDHLGELKEYGNESEELYRHICGTIVDDLRADLCHLYRYRHHDDTVRLLGRAYRHPIYSTNSTILQDQMENICDDDKDKAAVFRCIRKKEHIVHMTPKCQKQDNFFRKGLPNNVRTKSALIIPILHMGRVFGVIEVSGLVPYQFSYTDQQVLSNFEASLSQYLYHQHLLYSLEKITRFAFDNREEDNANQLCDVVSDIFLCKDATILVNNKLHPDSFTLYGSTRPELFEDQQKDMHGNVVIMGKSGCLKELRDLYIKNGDIYVVSDRPSSEEPFSDKLRTADLNYKLTFALTRAGTKRNTASNFLRTRDLIGAVMLHNDKPWEEDHSRWQAIIHVVNGQLVAVLDIVQALYDQQEDDELVIRHEISLSSKELLEIPGRVTTNLSALTGRRYRCEKMVREFLNNDIDDDHTWRNRFVQLILSLYGRDDTTNIGGHPMMPELISLEKKLENMEQRAKKLRETLRLYGYVRAQHGKVNLIHFFGEAPRLELLVEQLELRKVILDLVQGKIKSFNSKGIFVDYHCLPSGFFLKNVFAQMIYHWIGNMLDNGAKYIRPDTAYTISIESYERAYRLIFHNYGENLESGLATNPNDLFLRNVRSQNAFENHPGEGLGLFAVDLICNHLGIRHEIKYELANQGASYSFNFYIPASMVTVNRSARNFLRKTWS